MRWGNPAENTAKEGNSALFTADAVTTRTFGTPEFRGITSHEIRARSIVNRVSGASRTPSEWTANPYRGRTHACVHRFARKAHSPRGLDAGFASRIAAKPDAAELLNRHLPSRQRHGRHLAMGTDVDRHQRAEGWCTLLEVLLARMTQKDPAHAPRGQHTDGACETLTAPRGSGIPVKGRTGARGGTSARSALFRSGVPLSGRSGHRCDPPAGPFTHPYRITPT